MPRPATGSVYQRKDGRWVAEWREAGQRRFRYGDTEEMARRLLANRHEPDPEITLAAWCSGWLARQATALRPSTLDTYRRTLAKVTASIGTTPLSALTPTLLGNTFARLHAAGHGPRRLQLAYTYLRKALDEAVAVGALPRPHRCPSPLATNHQTHNDEPGTHHTVEATPANNKWVPLSLDPPMGRGRALGG